MSLKKTLGTAMVVLGLIMVQGIVSVQSDDTISLAKLIRMAVQNPIQRGEEFTKIPRSPAWIHNETKTIWEESYTNHGGEEFKVWLSRRSWESGEVPAGFYADSTFRKPGGQQ